MPWISMKNILDTMLKGSKNLSVSSVSHKDQAVSNIAIECQCMCATSENMSHCVPQVPLPKICLQKVPVWLTDTLFTVAPVLINFQAENVLLELFLGLNGGTAVIPDGSSY